MKKEINTRKNINLIITRERSEQTIVNENKTINNTDLKLEDMERAPGTVIGNIRYYLKGYSSLSKFKLSSLVLATTMVGYAMAPGPFSIPIFFLSSVGTGFTIFSAAAINQIIEVKNDSEMLRTKRRWLPTQKIGLTHAKLFAATCGVSGVTMLYTINPLASALALFNLVLYTSVYTPMKQKQPLNTWVGAIVGAVPPMIGWAASTGGLEAGSWVLGALLAFWQMPHFMALSYSLKDDYHRGGFRMLINTNPEKVTGVLLRYSLAMMPLGFLAYLCDMTTVWFAVDSLLPTGYLSYLAIKFYKNPDRDQARSIFKFTLLMLPLLLGLMIFHKIPRREQIKQEGENK